jgi:hypothetical protein
MRKLSLIIIVPLLLAVACKKKTTDTPTLTIAAPPVVAPLISAKVNGTTASCTTCYAGSQSGGIREANFTLSNNNNGELIRFFCTTLPSAGTYTLSRSTSYPSLMYQKNFTYYNASSGTLTIASIDTSQGGVINKMSATFSFKTDTTGGTFYTISEGVINLK